jgi:hypothetical protein
LPLITAQPTQIVLAYAVAGILAGASGDFQTLFSQTAETLVRHPPTAHQLALNPTTDYSKS